MNLFWSFAKRQMYSVETMWYAWRHIINQLKNIFGWHPYALDDNEIYCTGSKRNSERDILLLLKKPSEKCTWFCWWFLKTLSACYVEVLVVCCCCCFCMTVVIGIMESNGPPWGHCALNGIEPIQAMSLCLQSCSSSLVQEKSGRSPCGEANCTEGGHF